MVALSGGVFWMGSNNNYPEEGPSRQVQVDPFRIDPSPVTNRAFAAFVEATGYLTLAERPLDPATYPGADPAMLRPGSSLFVGAPGPVPLTDAYLLHAGEPSFEHVVSVVIVNTLHVAQIVPLITLA